MTGPLKFVDHSIEDFAMQVTYDPSEGMGTVVYNLSLIKNEDLSMQYLSSRMPTRPVSVFPGS